MKASQFCACVIVLEERTWQVIILAVSFQTYRGTFDRLPWAETSLSAAQDHQWYLVIDGSGLFIAGRSR